MALAYLDRPPLKKTSRLILALYLAATLVPFAHELLVDEGVCERCEALAQAGPALDAQCDGSRPCENPDHHHHHRHHDHAQCPVCQHAPTPGLHATRGQLLAALEATRVSALPRVEGFHGRRELCHNLARAPPALS